MKWVIWAIACAVAGICVGHTGDGALWAMGAVIAGMISLVAINE